MTRVEHSLAPRGRRGRPRRGTLAIAVALAAAALPSAPAAASPNGVVISEFRFAGPAGGNDEFIELRNTSAVDVDISGWRLLGCSSTGGAGTLRTSVPAGVWLPAGAHYLFTNSGSGGYSGTALGDRTYSTGVANTGGVQIATAAGAVIDGVGASAGATSPASPCREGAGLAIPTTSGDNTFRRLADETKDTDDNAADFERPATSDPDNLSGAVVTPTVTAISAIQGSGASSPLTGRTVTIEGIVTGWDDEIGANFERTFPEDAGLFVQEDPADVDASESTSEGIFVGFVRNRTAYPLGTRVRIEGRVQEKFGLTMLSETINQEPETIGGPVALPEPVVLDTARARAQGPGAGRTLYESLEGMRVALPVGVANSGGTNKFGELFLTPGAERDRVFRTEAEPSLLALVDDAGAGDPSNPYEPAAPSSTLVSADLFDEVRGSIGPLAFSFDHYKLVVQPGALPTVVGGPTPYPYPGLPTLAPREIRVASFNVENFLPVGSALDLGTVSQEEYDEKRDRIEDAIDRLLERPDVMAVQEVGTFESLQDLAADLGGYTAYLVEGNDSRGIDVGFLVRSTVTASNVRQLGRDATGPAGVRCSDVPGGLFDRPPLAIDVAAHGSTFTVLSNHFASKSAPDACRNAQAAFVRDRVAEIEANGGEAIVTGDLNAFEDEGALTTLTAADDRSSLVNLWSEAPEEERYSFAFGGRLQTLDHLLVTDGLRPLLTDFRYAHIDNDYAERHDPDDGHHVSDHDPPVATFQLPDVTDPTVVVTAPAEGADLILGSSVAASYTCADEAAGSGIASCTGSVPNGGAVDTATVGPKTLTVVARDTAGNTTTVTRTYRVIYRFSGFFEPVKNPPARNSFVRGRIVQVSFALGGDQGLDVFAPGGPQRQRIDCATGAATGTPAPAEGTLRYDSDLGRYLYLWRVPKTLEGPCHKLIVRLKDGTEHSPWFEQR